MSWWRRVALDEAGRLRVAIRLVLHSVVVLIGYGLGWLWMRATSGPWAFVTGVMVQTSWLVLSTWGFARWVDKRAPSELGFRRDHALRDGLAGALLGLVLIVSVACVEGSFSWASYVRIAMTREGQLAMVRAVILFVLVAIAEETWFRGYQLTNISEACARWGRARADGVALMLSSLFFGCAHILNPHATVLSTTNIVVGGVLLGVTFARTRRLAFPIGLHLTWNLTQALLDMPVSGQVLVNDVIVRREELGDDVWTGGAFGPEAGLLGLAVMVLGTLAGALYARTVEGPLGREVDMRSASCERLGDDDQVDDRPHLGGDSAAP